MLASASNSLSNACMPQRDASLPSKSHLRDGLLGMNLNSLFKSSSVVEMNAPSAENELGVDRSKRTRVLSVQAQRPDSDEAGKCVLDLGISQILATLEMNAGGCYQFNQRI